MTPKEFFKLAEEHGAEMVDLKFTDFLGAWQHCSYPIDTWDEGTFEVGRYLQKIQLNATPN